MVHIISDTSTLYSAEQARAAGFAVSALSVTIDGKTYRELEEMDGPRFLELIGQGHLPVSSQPALGEVTELYEEFTRNGDEVINLCMAEGLSGTYQSALAAADLCEGRDRISVVNVKTLCGPQRFLAERAAQMAGGGASRREILDWLDNTIPTAKSYLIPWDFDYLRRGGRLSPLVSHVGKGLGLSPVMTQTEDGTRLTLACVRRGFDSALKAICRALEDRGSGAGCRIYISHCGVPDKAEKARAMLEKQLPEAACTVLELGPAFITHGGPGCLAVQVIHE